MFAYAWHNVPYFTIPDLRNLGRTGGTWILEKNNELKNLELKLEDAIIDWVKITKSANKLS